MKRRTFIKNNLLLAGGVFFGDSLFAQNVKSHHLHVFHTNDMHSRVEAFPLTHSKYPGMGGMVNLSGKLNKLRQSCPDSLLLDSGDFLQGTPFFNEFGGKVEVEMMNMMGYDFVTLGNHEFDNGELALAHLLSLAKFKVLCANYDFTNSPLAQLVSNEPAVISKKLNNRLFRIGIIGVGVDLDGLATPKNRKGIVCNEPIAIANQQAAFLVHEQHCDIVIVLSHLGYQHDLLLAKQSENIDMILGGHSHTILSKPTMVTNLQNKEVVVNQMGRDALHLGHLVWKI